jgi:carbon monoxide dehydrogenase subunit G
MVGRVEEKVAMKWALRIVAILVALPLLGAAVLLAIGQRSGAGHTHASIEIQAPPERIWPWLDEGGRLKQWVSWLVEVREDSNAPHVAGAQRVWVMRDENNGGELMEIHLTYTQYAPPSHMSVRSGVAGVFAGNEGYHLTALGNGQTRIDADGQDEYQMWLARLMEPLITPQAEKKMRADLAHLKELVEKSETVSR